MGFTFRDLSVSRPTGRGSIRPWMERAKTKICWNLTSECERLTPFVVFSGIFESILKFFSHVFLWINFQHFSASFFSSSQCSFTWLYHTWRISTAKLFWATWPPFCLPPFCSCSSTTSSKKTKMLPRNFWFLSPQLFVWALVTPFITREFQCFVGCQSCASTFVGLLLGQPYPGKLNFLVSLLKVC